MIPSGSRTGSFSVEKIDKDIELIHSLLLVFLFGLCVIQITSPCMLIDSPIKQVNFFPERITGFLIDSSHSFTHLLNLYSLLLTEHLYTRHVIKYT